MENRKMTEAALEARRAYQRKWRRANPDKVKAREARYWERKAAEMAQETAAADRNQN